MAKYLIIGNGVAGTTAAENIRKHDQFGSITIITDEDLPFYYRIRLNDYIAGEVSEEGLLAREKGWYTKHDITLISNVKVIEADSQQQIVITDNNQKLSYEKLLIATGSHSFIPPIPGKDNPGVFTLRDISDARSISNFAATAENAVLIGGGLLGIETGHALRKLGKKVTIVEFFPRLLPRQLDSRGAEILVNLLESRGFIFYLGATTSEIKYHENSNRVIIDSGQILAADMVIISAGVRPNMELAEHLGVDVGKGIKVNERLQTTVDNIYAAGDVAEFRGYPPYGIWPAAMQQGKVAGTNMAGVDMTYMGTIMSTKLKVASIDLASAGEIDADGKYDSKVEETVDSYRKIIIDGNRIIGCILLGDTKDFSKLTKAINDQQNISEISFLT